MKRIALAIGVALAALIPASTSGLFENIEWNHTFEVDSDKFASWSVSVTDWDCEGECLSHLVADVSWLWY